MIIYLLSCLAIIIGFTNTNYTVDEAIGTLQVDVGVLNIPDERPLTASIDLVIQSVSGSASKCIEPVHLSQSIDAVYLLAGGSDYAEINAANLDVINDGSRRKQFNVTIIDDLEFEVAEDFTLELKFLTLELSNVISPNTTIVEIISNEGNTVPNQ